MYKKKKIATIFILYLMLLLFSACERLEIEERYYSNYEQLDTAGEPGNWVPSFAPLSAIEIRAKYKIDTGAELLTFRYSNVKEGNLDHYLAGHCNKIIMKDIEFPPKGFLAVDWWPNSLFSINLRKEENGYKFYRCERQSFLAIKH